MFIDIGEKIKKYRTSKGLTQEQFAQYLGVSCREVIKWESGGGYPDFELIPVIANYFEVTTDDLLCMENFSNEGRIREYLEKFHEYLSSGRFPQAIETMREGLLHFPNNYRFKCMLMYSLYLSCDRPSAIKHYSPEIISISEEILSGCTDDAIRLEAKRILCLHYYEDLHDVQSAREIAGSMPGRISSREDMLTKVSEGEDKLKFLADSVFKNLISLSRDISYYAESDKDFSNEEKIKLYELVNKIEDLIYVNGDYMDQAAARMQRFVRMMELYAKMGNDDMTLECLSNAADFAIMYDNTPNGEMHTSPILCKIQSDKHRIETAVRDPRSMKKIFIQDVLTNPCLEKVNYTDKMHKICERIGRA